MWTEAIPIAFVKLKWKMATNEPIPMSIRTKGSERGRQRKNWTQETW